MALKQGQSLISEDRYLQGELRAESRHAYSVGVVFAEDMRDYLQQLQQQAG